MLLDCNLFEINISYGFRNIKAINSLCQQPSAQLIVTLIEYPEEGVCSKAEVNRCRSLEWSTGPGIGFDGIVAL